MAKFSTEKGQSLIEVLVALAIGVVLISAATGAVIITLRDSLDARTTQVANSLSDKYADIIQALGESNWQAIYNLSGKGPNSQFYLAPSGSSYSIASGATTTQAEGQTFTLYFSAENVSRDLCGSGNITTAAATSCSGGPGTSGVASDPSTQKITINAAWNTGYLVSKVKYLTRYQNRAFSQANWSGGPGQESFPLSGNITTVNSQFSSGTNVDYSTTNGSVKIQGF